MYKSPNYCRCKYLCFRSVLILIIWFGSESSILGWIPIRIRIQGFDDQKLKKFTAGNIFWIKIYLSQGLHKGFPSYRRSLQPSKENIQHFKTWNFLIFSTSVGHFCSLDPNTDPLAWLNPDPIRIRNTGKYCKKMPILELYVFRNGEGSVRRRKKQ